MLKVTLVQLHNDSSRLYDRTWQNRIDLTNELIATFIEDEQFGLMVGIYRAQLSKGVTGGIGGTQVGIISSHNGRIEIYDRDDDTRYVSFSKQHIVKIFNLIEQTGAKLRTLRDQNKLPKEVIYTFDDDWNGSVEFKNGVFLL